MSSRTRLRPRQLVCANSAFGLKHARRPAGRFLRPRRVPPGSHRAAPGTRGGWGEAEHQRIREPKGVSRRGRIGESLQRHARGGVKAFNFSPMRPVPSCDPVRGSSISDCLRAKPEFLKCTEDDRAGRTRMVAGCLSLGYLSWVRKKGDKKLNSDLRYFARPLKVSRS